MTRTVEIIKWGPRRIAWLTSSNLDDVDELLNTQQVDGVGLSPHHGFDGDFSILSALPRLRVLIAVYADKFDCTPIQECSELRFLGLQTIKRKPFDFSAFSKLRELSIDWQSRDVLPSPGSQLESLRLRGYKPKSNDLTTLPAYANLISLELVQSGVTSLEGIARLRALREVDIAFCRYLAKINNILATEVEQVHFENCPNIADIPELAFCPTLRSIRLSACPDLESLKFLESSKKIETFTFVKMRVKDCDLSPLLKMKTVRFMDFRSYSHTCEEIQALINKPVRG
jgi:hypothetical protein